MSIRPGIWQDNRKGRLPKNQPWRTGLITFKLYESELNMLTQERARQIAIEWLESWNSHDIDRIMLHYAENIEFISPFAVKLLGAPDGTVRGKEALREYFSRGLAAYPDLQFHLHKILPGVRSVTICYESVNDLMAAEVMEIDGQGRIERVQAHYTPK